MYTHMQMTPTKINATLVLLCVQKGNRSPGISDLDLVEKLVVYISGGPQLSASTKA